MANPAIYVYPLKGYLKASCDRSHEGDKLYTKQLILDPKDKNFIGGKALLLAMELAKDMGWTIPFCDWVVGQINQTTFTCTPIGEPAAYEPVYYCSSCEEKWLLMDLDRQKFCPVCHSDNLIIQLPTPYKSKRR